MIWDIIIKIALAGLVAAGGRVCYLIGYSKGLSYGINEMNRDHNAK